MADTEIRRQPHGIRAETLNMTLGADEVARLRREAASRGITVSRHIRDLVRYAWACRELHDAARAPESIGVCLVTTLDPTYARRLRRAIEDALTRVYGREAALRMIREAGRRSATAPESDSTGVVVGGDFHAPQLGGNHYGKTDLDGRDAAR